jgi:hypothetical protein
VGGVVGRCAGPAACFSRGAPVAAGQRIHVGIAHAGGIPSVEAGGRRIRVYKDNGAPVAEVHVPPWAALSWFDEARQLIDLRDSGSMGDDMVRELSVWELFEAPRPARTLRQLPGLLVRAIRFVLTADLIGMILVSALALVAALGSGIAVLVTQRVLADVLAAGQLGAGLGSALPALALLALVNIVLGLARTL